MRILIVGQYFPPEPVKVGDLARGLHEMGHQVTVLTGFPNYPYGRLYDGFRIRLFQREDQNGITVIRVPIYADHSYAVVKRFLNYLSFVIAGSVLGPFLVGHYDRIIVFQTSPITMGIPAVVLRRLRGGRLLFWVQDVWPDTLEALGIGLPPWALKGIAWLVKAIYTSCDLVIIPSRGFVDKITEHGYPPDRIVYLPNWAEGVYRVQPYDDEFAKREGLDGHFNVVFAGVIGVAQGLETVLEAASCLTDREDIRFIIVGDGAMYTDLVESAKRRNLRNVVFTGRRAPEQMPRFFAAAGALLVLLRRSDLFARTIPGKLQSYMACGRPIIAALEGSGADVVRESGAGVVCPPDDPEALCAAVLHLSALSEAEREELGRRARSYYEAHFDREVILHRLNALLAPESPMGEPHPARSWRPVSWQQRYLERFYARHRGWVDGTTEFHRICTSVIPAGGSILEVGAGPSNDTSRFLKTLGVVHGIDVDQSVLMNDALATAHVIRADVYPFPPETFDGCVSNYVIEHLANVSAHLREVHRVLKPGGVYVFRTPNQLHYTTLVARLTPFAFHRLAANRLRGLPPESHSPYPTFYRMNSPAAVRRAAAQCGFTVDHVRLVEKEPAYGMSSRVLFLSFLAYERLVNALEVLAVLRANIFAVLRKRA